MKNTASRIILMPVFAGLFALATALAIRSQTEVLNLGGVLVSVSDSRTAQIFHIVDQMSDWDASVHHGYVRWAKRVLKLGPAEQALLQKHAEIRRPRGWGGGFEQAFYVDGPIEDAANRAVSAKLLTRDEADTEKTILLHFAPILSGMLDEKAAKIAAFRERLKTKTKKVSPLVKQLLKFSETKGILRVPLFLIPNPEEGNGGGGYNGGSLVVEIEDDPDPMPVLLHECLHSLLWHESDAITTAAASVGLSWGELNEGITSAFSPGLTDDPAVADTLGERIAINFKGRPPADGYSQSKKYLVALILRPLLRQSIARKETFSVFLPKAVEKLKRFDWQK